MRRALVKYNAEDLQSALPALRRLGITPTWRDGVEESFFIRRAIFPSVRELTVPYLKEHDMEEKKI